MSLGDSTYQLLILDTFWDYVEKNLPKELRKVLDKKLEYFRANPKHPSLNTKPFHCGEKILRQLKQNLNVDEVYEFYINRRDYRCIVYVLHEEKILIVAYIGNHTQVKNKFA